MQKPIFLYILPTIRKHFVAKTDKSNSRFVAKADKSRQRRKDVPFDDVRRRRVTSQWRLAYVFLCILEDSEEDYGRKGRGREGDKRPVKVVTVHYLSVWK